MRLLQNYFPPPLTGGGEGVDELSNVSKWDFHPHPNPLPTGHKPRQGGGDIFGILQEVLMITTIKERKKQLIPSTNIRKQSFWFDRSSKPYFLFILLTGFPNISPYNRRCPSISAARLYSLATLSMAALPSPSLKSGSGIRDLAFCRKSSSSPCL